VTDDATAQGRPLRHRSAGAVVIHDGRCLLLRRGRAWSFPKGHVEPGETAEDAALREVREETGLEIALLGYVGATRYEFRSDGGRLNLKHVSWFAGQPVGGSLRLEPRFEEAACVPLGSALALLTFRADRRIAVGAFELAAPGMGHGTVSAGLAP